MRWRVAIPVAAGLALVGAALPATASAIPPGGAVVQQVLLQAPTPVAPTGALAGGTTVVTSLPRLPSERRQLLAYAELERSCTRTSTGFPDVARARASSPAALTGPPTATVQSKGFYDTGVGRFLLSPGFGGLAALIGGLLAFAAAKSKAKDDRVKAAAELVAVRAQAGHARETARQDRWWDTLKWIYDRATAPPPEAALPGGLALDMFARLYAEAQTDLEVQAVRGLMDLFEDQTEAPE